jgi:hypothetical protein
MKKTIAQWGLVLYCLLLFNKMFAQTNSYFCLQEQTTPDNTAAGLPFLSYYGKGHTPKGELAIMMVFVTFAEDDANPAPDNLSYFWPKNNVPVYAAGYPNKLLDAPGASPSGLDNLSRWFQLMSNYDPVTGNGFSLRGKIFHVQINKTVPPADVQIFNGLSNFDKLNYLEGLYCKRAALALQSTYPNEDWSKYDQRKNYPNFLYDNSKFYRNPGDVFTPARGDGQLDYVNFCFRLDHEYTRTFVDRGGYSAVNLYQNRNFVGMPTITGNGQTFTFVQGHTTLYVMDELTHFSYFLHEFSHPLFTDQHYMGANTATGDHFYTSYGWGMMSEVYKYFLTANAWEKWFHGWMEPQLATPSQTTYTIKDFVTQNDAIRIPIPNTDNEFLWIENHQLLDSFDKKITYPNFPMPKGLYMYVTDNDDREKPFYISPNRFKVLSRNGNKDYAWVAQNGGFAFTTAADNPISGQTASQLIRGDFDGNNIIKYTNLEGEWDNESQRIYHLDNQPNIAPFSGTSANAFSVGDEISLSGTFPALNYPSTKTFNFFTAPETFELEEYKLNGIRVKVLSYNVTTGEYTIEVIFNDYEVRNNKRWAGHIDLPNTTNNSDPDLVIKSGKTLIINQSATPDKLQWVASTGSFTTPSKFTCKANASIIMESNSKIIVDQGSTFSMEAGSRLEINNGAVLDLRQASTLDVAGNAHIVVNYGGKLLVNSHSRMVYNANADVYLNDGSVIEVTDNGKIEIAANATFTWEGKGIVRFNTATRGVSNVVASGTNAHFYKRGNGTKPYDDKLVEITGGGSLSIDKTVSSFTLRRGHVLMGENALLDVDPKMSCTQVKFTGDIRKRHNGIIVYGQQNDAYLTDCVVENARWGFLALNFSGTAKQAKLSGCKFSNNIIGAYIQGRWADVSYCTFWNNIETGIRLDMLTLPAYLNKITAESNGIGLVANSTAYSLINVNNSVFYANKTGIHATDAMLSTGCSRVHKSLTSNVVAGNFTTLAYEPARWPATGNSLFYNEHDHGIVADQASDLHLDKAHNHFQVNNTTGIFGFYGMLKGRGTVLPPRKPVQADENYWNTAGTAPVMFTPSVTTADYSLQYRYGTTTPDLAITDQHPLTTAPGFSVCTPGGGGSTLPGTGGGQPAVVADKPALTLSNGQDAGVYFVDGLNLLYSDLKYTDAITVYSLLINHPYDINKTILLPTGEYTSEFGVWSDFVMASYEKMLEAFTLGIAAGRISDYAIKPEWYNVVKDAQDNLISRFAAGGDAYEYEYAVKLRIDRALLYLLMNKPDTGLLQLVNLLEGEPHTIANENLLKFMVCNVQRQIQLRNQQITRLDYAALSEGCAETLGLVYETTALSLTKEPADPPYVAEQPPALAKRGNIVAAKKAKETHVSAAATNDVVVYPNPSKGLLYIDPLGNTIHEVVVYDVLGKVVLHSRSAGNIQLVQAGMYMVEIKTNSGTYLKKVVIEQ